MDHAFEGGAASLTVRASGSQADGEWRHMVVSVGGIVVGDTKVESGNWQDYTFSFVQLPGLQEVRVAFDNDFYQPPADRNLFVDNVTIACAL